MNSEFYNKVWDILVLDGGAYEPDRFSFVDCFVNKRNTEWRFQGKLGFGGKYRAKNTVDCYFEDETPEIKELIRVINYKLDCLLKYSEKNYR